MKEQQTKAPIKNEAIFKLLLTIVYAVAALYFVKNIIGGAIMSAVVNAACLIVLAVVMFIMKKKHASQSTQQMVVSVAIAVMVFIISISSGAYYSDDYCLYMAVIGISGLFMEPAITRVQAFLIPVLLIIQYLIHPEKVESRGQFIMCVAIFCLASYIQFLLVKRGKAFIAISANRAEEAEELMVSMQIVGSELQTSVDNTTAKYEELQEVNIQLCKEADELRNGSDGIKHGTLQVVESCDDVHMKIQTTEQLIEALNEEVGGCEAAIDESRSGLEEMNRQMNVVKHAMDATNEVFSMLEAQMSEISGVIEELNKIASSTTMLALNASIEAARAGQSGAGFAVVATKVQELAVDSTSCSKKVEDVLVEMQNQIKATTVQMNESSNAIGGSLESLDGLHANFDSLVNRFDRLYRHIEEQNVSIKDVDSIFEELKDKISGMNEYSEENQLAVESISKAIDRYQENLQIVIGDSKHISEVTENMLMGNS